MREMRGTAESPLVGVFDQNDTFLGIKTRRGDYLPMAGAIGGSINAAARLALLGDSNGSAMFNVGGTTIEHQAHGYGSYIGPLSMQRAQVVASFALGGQKVMPDGVQPAPLSVQIDQFLASSAADTATHVVTMFGTNDVGVAPSLVAAEYVRQLRRLSSYKVILMTIYPPGNLAYLGGSYEAGTVRWQWVMRFNALLRQIAADNPGWVSLVDAHALGVDPTSATGQAAANMLYDDSLHSSNLYAQRVGKAIVDVLCAGMPPVYPWLTSAADLQSLAAGASEKPTNVLANGLFTASAANGMVGNVQAGTTATNWAVSTNGGATVTPGMVASPNGFGSCQQLSCSMTAQNDFVRYTGPSFTSQIAPVDELYSQFWVRIPGGSGICAPRLTMTVIMDGVTYYRTAFANVMANAKASLDACDMLIRTPTLKLPAGVSITTASAQLTLFAVGAGAAGSNVLVGQAEARRVLHT